jgi:hypothetical protein
MLISTGFLLVTKERVELYLHSVCVFMAMCFATGITSLLHFKILLFNNRVVVGVSHLLFVSLLSWCLSYHGPLFT